MPIFKKNEKIKLLLNKTEHVQTVRLWSNIYFKSFTLFVNVSLKHYDLNDNRHLTLLAFQVMEKAAIYLTSLEHRTGILKQCAEFFKDANNVDTKLKEIETTLSALDECNNNKNELVHQLTSLKNLLEKILFEITEQGESLISNSSRYDLT